jgi:hypothetical protein
MLPAHRLVIRSRHLAAGAVALLIAASASAVTVVTQEDLGDTWHLADTRADATVTFAAGPGAPPSGVGSAHLDTSCSAPGCSLAKAQLLTDVFGSGLAEGVANPDRPSGGLRLADIDAISYWSWRAVTNTNPAPQVISLNMEVDYVGNGTSFTTLVYEPIYNAARQGPIVPGTWQDWDAYDAGQAIWWSTRSIPGTPAFTFSSTWSQIVANNPNARIVRFFGFNVGSGWSGVSQNAGDLLTLGTTTEGDHAFDFEAERPVRIDVRPNNAENQINTQARQVVPIAILSEAGWDACAEVDRESVDVRGAAASVTSSECDDVDGDGLGDLVLRFRARDMEDPSPEECASADPMIELTGFTTAGQPIRGTDSVTWTGPSCD